MAEASRSGQRFRAFNFMERLSRKALRIEIDRSLPATRVIRALDELLEVRGKPQQLPPDNGPDG